MNSTKDKWFVDLQWFGDADEAQPQIGWSNYDEEIEIVSPEDQQREEEGEDHGKSREDLLAEVQQLRQTAQDAAPAPNPELAVLQTQIEQLRAQQGGLTPEQLRALASTSGQPQQQQGESQADFEERIKEHIYDNPVASVREVVARDWGPDLQRIVNSSAETNKYLLRLDPVLGPTYSKYKKEVDAAIDRLDPVARLDPQAAVDACQQVRATHFEDILQEEVQKAIKSNEAPASAAGEVNPLTGKPRQHAEVSSAPNPAGGGGSKRRVVLTEAEKKHAAALGLREPDYAAWKLRHKGGV